MIVPRSPALAACVAALTLVAAGCGDDDADPADQPAPPTVVEDSMVDDAMTEDSMVDDAMREDSMSPATTAP